MRDLNTTDEFFAFMADAIEPICAIFDDPEMIELQTNGADFSAIYALLFRKHSEGLLRLVAAAEGQTVDTFRAEFSPTAFPMQLSAVLSHPVVQSLFGSAEQKTTVTSSGSAPDNGRE